jgi:hypothetical protein
MINVLERSCKENQNTLSYSILFLENSAVYEIMSKNMVEPRGGGRPQMTSRHDAYALHAG